MIQALTGMVKQEMKKNTKEKGIGTKFKINNSKKEMKIFKINTIILLLLLTFTFSIGARPVVANSEWKASYLNFVRPENTNAEIDIAYNSGFNVVVLQHPRGYLNEVLGGKIKDIYPASIAYAHSKGMKVGWLVDMKFIPKNEDMTLYMSNPKYEEKLVSDITWMLQNYNIDGLELEEPVIGGSGQAGRDYLNGLFTRLRVLVDAKTVGKPDFKYGFNCPSLWDVSIADGGLDQKYISDHRLFDYIAPQTSLTTLDEFKSVNNEFLTTFVNLEKIPVVFIWWASLQKAYPCTGGNSKPACYNPALFEQVKWLNNNNVNLAVWPAISVGVTKYYFPNDYTPGNNIGEKLQSILSNNIPLPQTPGKPSNPAVTTGPTVTSTPSVPAITTQISSQTVSTAPINLIDDPDFETDKTSWQFFTGGTGTFSKVSPGYEGNKAAMIALGSMNSNIQLYQEGVALEPNTLYRLSFAAKSNTGHDLTVKLLKHVSPYITYKPEYSADLGTDWQTFTTDFTTSGFSETVNDGRFMFWFADFAKSGDIYYIDDIRLEKVSAPVLPTIITQPSVTVTSKNLIKNPGFESGTSTWFFHNTGAGTLTAESPGYGGIKAANIALKSGASNIQLYQKDVALEPNTRYRLSFAAYSNNGDDMTVGMYKHISPYTNYGLDFKADLTTRWQTFTTEFTTRGFTGTVSDGRLMFWLAPFGGNGDIYRIDDVRLEKIS